MVLQLEGLLLLVENHLQVQYVQSHHFEACEVVVLQFVSGDLFQSRFVGEYFGGHRHYAFEVDLLLEEFAPKLLHEGQRGNQVGL